VRPFRICSGTDGSLLFLVERGSASVDLSKATKLKDVTFQSVSQRIRWITATLKTIPKHRGLREVLIYLPSYVGTTGVDGNAKHAIGEESWREWLDLDRLLVRLWESSSIRLKLTRLRLTGIQEPDIRYHVGYRCLFPEITKRGIFDLVEPRVFHCINRCYFLYGVPMYADPDDQLRSRLCRQFVSDRPTFSPPAKHSLLRPKRISFGS
jgi:hypothetical protein